MIAIKQHKRIFLRTFYFPKHYRVKNLIRKIRLFFAIITEFRRNRQRFIYNMRNTFLGGHYDYTYFTNPEIYSTLYSITHLHKEVWEQYKQRVQGTEMKTFYDNLTKRVKEGDELCFGELMHVHVSLRELSKNVKYYPKCIEIINILENYEIELKKYVAGTTQTEQKTEVINQ